jgi:hypothetical protein
VKARALKKLAAAERAVNGLVQECGKQGPLYQHDPKAVAQVSRTGKWLLNAMSALRNALATHCTKETT